MEKFAIYRDYQKAVAYEEQQKVNHLQRKYDAEDLEGFKLMFPAPEPEEIQEEFCDDFIEPERCYDNPETSQQLYELERFGYFYK